MKPSEIEAQSFAIIDKEAGPHQFSRRQWQIVRRMIHTSADFDYLTSTIFHPQAVSAGIQAIRGGKPIFTDTNMLRIGIRAADLERLGIEARCLMADPETARRASEAGTTRAKVAVDMAAPQLNGGIYAVGNAPTALLRLMELMESGAAHPALVVGLPVGFVNAAESKAALSRLDTPFITNQGRKGGSNLAAGVINALILLALEDD